MKGATVPKATHGSPAVGLVGLGQMGWPMASRLFEAGFDIAVFDLRADHAKAFAHDVGGQAFPTLRDLAAKSDVIITMLPNSHEVGRALFEGPDCLASGIRAGTLLIEMSSGLPAKTVEISGRLKELGVDTIDGPVSGGVVRAKSGELAIMVGGESDSIDRAKPVLEAMGKTISRTGEIGSAHAMKALNNLMSAGGFLIGVEALLIGRKFGLDPNVMVDVLNESSGMNNSTKTKFKQFVLSETYGSGFSLDLMVKDLTTATSIARELGITAPFASVCRELWAQGLSLLGPGQDHTAMSKMAEKTAGQSLVDNDELVADGARPAAKRNKAHLMNGVKN